MTNEPRLKEEFNRVLKNYEQDSTNNFLGRPAVRAIMWDKSGGICWYCGHQTNPFRDFSIDHIIPECLLGKRTYDNLVPCCRDCNRLKSGCTLPVFRERLLRKTSSHPDFTEQQLDWLQKQGINVPLISVSEFKFYFEKIREQNG